MLGAAKPRRLDQPIAVSLDELVPKNHFYRHLEAKLDLGFVRSWARELYADRGRPSIDAVVFFNLQLVMFFEGIRSELFGRDVFTYDAARDQYCCPQGHTLPLARSKRTEGVVVYRGDPVICNACPAKTKCTTSDRGRTIQRSIYERCLEKVRSYHTTEPYKKAIRKPLVWVEPLFAEAKEWHGLRRLRLRGLLSANIQGLLIAAGQDLKRFLAATGWGRRNAPCGSLLALPAEPPGLSLADS